MSAIRTRSLTKRYGTRLAVDALDLEVPEGAVAGFVGPNGAGKTTAMAMLLGLVRPSSGTGEVLGHPLADPEAYLSRVGALVEGPALYPALTGHQNLAVLATLGGHDPAAIPGLLELVGLADRAHDRFGRYSLGMKQRLGIAAALLGDPRLLVLDEPANGLDPAGIRELRDLLARLADDGRPGLPRTVFVSSHALAELEAVCDWLVMIDHGRLVFQGPAADLLGGGVSGVAVAAEAGADLAALERALVASGHDVEHRGRELVVRVDSGDHHRVGAAVNRAAFEAGIVVAELRAVRSNLEDRYLSMITGGDR